MSLLFKKLCGRLRAVSEGYEGVMGVAVKDLTSGDSFTVNGDEVFPVASTIKVPILIEFYRRVEAKTLDPMAPVRYVEGHKAEGSGVIKTLTPGAVTMPLIDYVALMINVSDNSSTNYLIDLLGMEEINSTISAIGLRETRLARKMMDMEAFKAGKDSFTTPREMVALFEELHSPKVLSPYACGETLKNLKRPKEGMVQGVIRNAVPDSVEVADKSGWVGGGDPRRGDRLPAEAPLRGRPARQAHTLDRPAHGTRPQHPHGGRGPHPGLLRGGLRLHATGKEVALRREFIT